MLNGLPRVSALFGFAVAFGAGVGVDVGFAVSAGADVGSGCFVGFGVTFGGATSAAVPSLYIFAVSAAFSVRNKRLSPFYVQIISPCISVRYRPIEAKSSKVSRSLCG